VRWIALLLVFVLAGCAHDRLIVTARSSQPDVDFEVSYELRR
jgi:hypothetical protein